MQTRQKIALISVYDKNGIEDFAKSLVALGWKIISSGGTAKYLSKNGVPVSDVAEITGMPPILDHRVVTLHPKIHGGLLALDTPEHLAELQKYDIPFIDMVCCDLYPLEEEIAKYAPLPNLPLNKGEERRGSKEVIEKTDIGGPAMIRSGQKGRRITICDPSDRVKVIAWLKAGEPDKENFLNNLAAKAEFIIARYVAVSGWYHGQGKYQSIFGERAAECAYGENAYQKPASLYKVSRAAFDTDDKLAIHNWQLVAGSSLSYNNFCDLDRMMQTMTHIGAGFEKNFGSVPYVAIGAKHGNACGVGVDQEDVSESISKMLLGDLRAIFGGCVMLNFNVDEKIAEELIHKFAGEGRRLLDIVAAPSFSTEAVEILSRKKGKCRLLANPAISNAGMFSLDVAKRFRYVRGGFLEQPNYTFVPELPRMPLDIHLSKGILGNTLKDVILAWAIGCTSNSNTITLVKEGRLYGNGVGQQDRVGAAKLAIFRADEANNGKADLEKAVSYSDSFFPFTDAVEVLISRGIKTIFATSGSINDEKIIELCKQKGINLILLPDSEARGFYQH